MENFPFIKPDLKNFLNFNQSSTFYDIIAPSDKRKKYACTKKKNIKK
jgi:hypothetical protein